MAQTAPSSRYAATQAIADALDGPWDLVPIDFDPQGLDGPEARLATIIVRATSERLLTLQHLIAPFLRQPFEDLEPSMRAILLTGAAQILLLPRLPTHAVVDESVRVAKRLIRPKAAGMVNAILRRVSEQVLAHNDEPWTPAADRVPSLDGGSIQLKGDLLPDPASRTKHLSIALSYPEQLIEAWTQQLGDEECLRLLRHGLNKAPIVLASPNEVVAGAQAHQRDGSWVWMEDRKSLSQYLGEHPEAWVQDSASRSAVAATRDLRPKRIFDACAGRGTKTRQLAAEHPEAKVFATDTDRRRRGDLITATAHLPNVSVVEPGSPPADCDLILLDVPCSNTGVLARRTEAKYRYNGLELEKMVDLQQRICEAAGESLSSDGWLLYSTCSLEPSENQRQARWLESRLGLSIEAEQQLWPEGEGITYQDGAYHALLKRRQNRL
jgi:16S rRNA (cytosine967-C5)-methyltransferase